MMSDNKGVLKKGTGENWVGFKYFCNAVYVL